SWALDPRVDHHALALDLPHSAALQGFAIECGDIATASYAMCNSTARLAISQPLQARGDRQQHIDGQRGWKFVVTLRIGCLALLLCNLLTEGFDGVSQLAVIRSTVHVDHSPKCFRLGRCQLWVEVR